MGYQPRVPWSRPDQDEAEAWASWYARRHRPAVHLPDEEQPEPEALVASTCLVLVIVVAIAVWLLHGLGVL